MAWRAARSLLRLQDAVNSRFPGRDKSNDGFIGDSAHASRKSDHNPNSAGVVCAFDITNNSPILDAHALADYLMAHPDKRVNYIISRRRIGNPGKSWRSYTGNPHTEHIHVSVKQDAKLYDDESPWDIGLEAQSQAAPAKRPDTLRRGSLGEDVEVLQWLLGAAVDGDFGPDTDAIVRGFQTAHELTVDGIVGAATWAKLRAIIGPVLPPDKELEFPFWGKGSWYSQYSGKHTWIDRGDKPNSSALGVPDDCQGISLYSRDTLGKWFTVRAPNGVRSLEQQTDVGPHPDTGRKIDISAAAAERFGYSPQNFPTDELFHWTPTSPPLGLEAFSPKEQALKYHR